MTNAVDASFWQQLQFYAVIFSVIAQVWFVTEFTSVKYKLPKYIITACYIILLIIALTGGHAVLFSGTEIQHGANLFSRVTITYIEMGLGPVWMGLYFLLLVVYIYFLCAVIYSRKVLSKKRSIAISVFLFIYFLTVVNDVLVGRDLLSSVYILEYSFLVFAILMTQLLREDLVKAAKTKKKLERTEENLSRLLEFSPAAIAVVSSDRRIRSLNKQFISIFGYNLDDMTTLDDWFKLAFPEKEKYQLVTSVWASSVEADGFPPPIETSVICKTGLKKTIMFNFTVIDTEFVIACTDISEQRNLLRQKESLIQELYHRTKNNLQLISSFINIKADMNKSEVLNAFALDIGNKVYAMSIIQRLIYASEDISRINLREFLLDLTIYLQQALSISIANISIITDFDDLFIRLDNAVPCGFVLEEIITNALKHAFPGERTGKIIITIVKKKDNFVIIDVIDDGVGMEQKTFTESDSMIGLNLVRTLVEDQLQGKIAFKTDNGLAVRIEFNDG